MDTELERIKTDISLADYAQAEFGYELVKRESSANSKVLKAGGDKIIITRQQDGHDVYFSVGDDRDCGSIIDFLQKRKKANLGQARRELRQWLPDAKRPAARRPKRAPDRPVATTQDRADLLRRWASMEVYSGSYLAQRGLTHSVVTAFDVRQDARGNACFAHKNGDGVLGWEVKNEGFTGFAAGGQRNVSFTRPDPDQPLRRLIITESAIDAMSWAQLKHEPGTAYLSTGGSALSEGQAAQLARLFEKNPQAVIVLAMDKDEAGEQMARQVASLAPQGAQIVRDVPTAGKDWNDALRADLRARQERDRGESLTM